MSGVTKVKVFVERADNRPWKYVTLEIPNHILKDDNLLYQAIEARLIDTLQEPFGGWDIISTEVNNAESEEKKDWMGISLAGTVDEIFEMLSAEEARKNYKSCDACHSKNYLYVMEDETLCDYCITGMEQEWKNIFGRRPDVRGYTNIDIQNPKYFPDDNTRQTVLPEFTRYDWYRQRQFPWEERLGWITLGALGWGLISAIWAGRDSNGN